MADAAIARREARRRKILENSYNRLQLISGAVDNATIKEPIITPTPIENIDNSVRKESSSINNCILNNGMINPSEAPLSFLSTNRENFMIGDGDVTNLGHDLAAFMPPSFTSPTPEPTPASPSLLEKVANYKYDIVVLSLLIQLLHYFSFVTFEGTYFFLPLVLYGITKHFWFPKHHNSNIANILLLLNGISASRAQKIMSIVQYGSVFSQDVCIFLFTTVCMQLLCQTIRGNLL